jgi:hypothetical protein
MRAADPPLRSYDALARASLARPSWPDRVRPQPRSLAAVFSKLDRNLELDWLAEREEVQRVLADVCGCRIADLRAAVERPRMEPRGTVRRVRIQEVRQASALDLAEEDLCPGLPKVVLNPAAWGQLWWSAPTGSGRTLAGQWLAARGLATFVAARTWADARPQLPAQAFEEGRRSQAALQVIGDRLVQHPFQLTMRVGGQR